LCVRDGGAEVTVTAARHRVLLAALVIRAGHVLSMDELAEAVWDGEPSPGARVTLRSYVKRLRQVLGPVLGQRIVARGPGYLITAGDAEVDLKRFEGLCRAGCRACDAGAWQEASDLLTRALGLWRGAPLADIGSQVLQRVEVPRLEQLRLQAAERQIEAGLHLGHHGQLVPGLQALVAEHPLRERFHAQLMLALHRCGRRAEALAVYRQARGILVGELGVEPGPELRQLHQFILTGDPELNAPPVQVPAAVPRQLPAAVPHFAGRQGELAALTALLKRPGGAGTHAAVVISAIGGTAGVGKTALAVHWAHRAAPLFPDGQLYVNLRGYDPGQPVPAADALAGFLRALGVPGQEIPAELEERAARYRSMLSGRQVLVILDNASDVEQVRPLLPGTAACMAVVTSRDALAGLIARDGAARLDLDLLPLHDAVSLLRSLVGRRADEDLEAAARLAAQCARLPLALRIAAELAAARPAIPLAELAWELASRQQRLDLLDAAGDGRTAIRAVFSWSYQNLSQPAARLFRLLGLHPGLDVTVHAAASLASTTPARARRLLDELARAHLLTEQAPGRFGCHDLLRAYAVEQAATTGSRAGRRAAMNRLLDYYLHTAATADRQLYPARRQIALTAPWPGVTPDDLASHGQALAWLDAEHRGLLAAINLAAENGYHVHAWQLAFNLETFFYRRGHWQDWAATQRTALAAAHRLGDQYAQTLAHSGIANALVQVGRPAEALSHLAAALRLREEAGDLYGQARVYLYFGWALESQGRDREALASSRQALRLSQAAGPPAKPVQAEAFNQVGWELAKLGRYPQALSYCQRAVAINEQLGSKHHQPAALDSLAYVYRHLGHHAEAADCYRRAVELFDELGHRYQKAETLAYAGEAYHADGNPAAARRAWEQALAILDDLRHPNAEHLRAKLHQPTDSSPGAKMIPDSHGSLALSCRLADRNKSP
jgi:DNA-binding SARP family transcriptional activator/tetratricopeptide (TPR) repeat protein